MQTSEHDLSFYQTLFSRRDVRGEFLPDTIPPDKLARILQAAHHAPSVGYSQPWDFILVKQAAIKQQVYQAFNQANIEASQMFSKQKRKAYNNLKLQGINSAPINILLTCDRSRGGEVVLGKTHQSEMDIYSCVCAIQNLWLAARFEDIGMGWVSIIKPQHLVEIFKLPESVKPIAYLCLGYVSSFRDKPELQEKRWADRLPIETLLHENQWGETCNDTEFLTHLTRLSD